MPNEDKPLTPAEAETAGVLFPWADSASSVGALQVPVSPEAAFLYVYLVETEKERTRILLPVDPYEPENVADLSSPDAAEQIEEYILDEGSIVLVAERATAPRVSSYVITHDTGISIPMSSIDLAVGDGALNMGMNVISNLAASLWPEFAEKVAAAQPKAPEQTPPAPATEPPAPSPAG